MKVFLFVIGSIFFLASCGDKKIALLNEIKDAENILFEQSKQLKPDETISLELDQALVKALSDFYIQFPKDTHAPECLDKLHMKYSGSGDFKKAAMYGDTLLLKYEYYVNRAMILESLANIHDMNLSPRDTSKVRFYSEMLLKENPDLPLEKVEDINYRLDNINLTIRELIQKRISEE